MRFAVVGFPLLDKRFVLHKKTSLMNCPYMLIVTRNLQQSYPLTILPITPPLHFTVASEKGTYIQIIPVGLFICPLQFLCGPASFFDTPACLNTRVLSTFSRIVSEKYYDAKLNFH